ncbi:MAG TPA: hypothetical protein VEY11_00155, partial [Pyrinomonadaceae bacterium]|nr:hypothetical protein [Pyrinomonadaceae bacterium]
MSEQKTNQHSPRARPADVESDAPRGAVTHEESSPPDADETLKALLDGWQSPPVPASLDARVLNSYRELLKEKEMNFQRPGQTLLPQYALPGEYRLTILEERGLLSRLLAEVCETARDAELTRAELRRDPLGFLRRLGAAYTAMAWRALSRENTAYGIAAAFAVVLTLVGAVAALNNFQATRGGLLAERVRDDLTYLGGVTEIPKAQPTPDEGTAGIAKGTGGGSKPKQEKPGGGGGGGRQEAKPASFGKLPPASLTVPQVVAPNPRPPTIKNPNLPVAASIVADPTLFPPDNRQIAYGDPKSRSTETSSGTGTGNGIG